MDYEKIIDEKAQVVFDTMSRRVSASDLQRIKRAFGLARGAHATQKRKSGEPYILHPIAVATIAACELHLDANPVIAAFLHDVVEDTRYTIEDIQRIFGDDVAFLVRVVTKRKKHHYELSKQLDNFKEMLVGVQYDIRALLVKLADRLHNMRTLSSMRQNKQMKIAGETDYFYAPLANRLGLYNVKTELENLSLKFRCPHEYQELESQIAADKAYQSQRLLRFRNQISEALAAEGIEARVYTEYRHPYSVWRKMQKYGDDFNHLKYRHFTDVVFDKAPEGMSEKDMVLRIYSILTDHFKEKPGGITNYIDSPKENGYQSFHVKLLADFGRWQEVHISSARMILASQIGVMATREEDNIQRWIEKFRVVLRDLAHQSKELSPDFMETVVTSFYNDDIMTFTPKGRPVILPQRATVLDFAYEVHTELGTHAKYARINNQLASIKTRLHRGDVVEVFTCDECHPTDEWLDTAITYKARKAIRLYLASRPVRPYERCRVCHPIPGEEVVGFRQGNSGVILHKRDCPEAVRMASRMGDDIVSVSFQPDPNILYTTTISIKAVDRRHLFIDLVSSITNDLNLNIDSIHADTTDAIVNFDISFGVHSYEDLRHIMSHISHIDGVDEVKCVNSDNNTIITT